MLHIGRKEPCLRNILPVERMLDKQKNVYECRNFPLLYTVFEGILNTQRHTHKSVVNFVIPQQRTSTPPLDYKLFFTTKQDLVWKKLLVSSISCVIVSSDSPTFRKN